MAYEYYDYIVLGCGGIGSGALYWLSKKTDKKVLGIEQFELGHHNGGSQDYSRIIRVSGYGEAMTPIAPYAYKAWESVEKESGLQIVTKTGGVYWKSDDAPPGSEHYMQESVAAMKANNIPFEKWSAGTFMERFPQFTIPHHYEIIYQKDMGFVDPSKGNAAHQQLAQGNGAKVLENCPVQTIEPLGKGAKVITDKGIFECGKLIITAGAWVQRFLSQFDLDLHLTITQEQVTYYKTPNLREFAPDRFPIFLVPTPVGGIYGFPIHGEVATKAAIDFSGPIVTPETRNFEPNVEVEEYQEAWLKKHIPGFLGPKLYTKTCLYTMPRDRQFILDSVPNHPDILVCCGAGQAYKFASVFGQILGDLATNGKCQHNIAALSFNRSAITDQNYDSKVLNRVNGISMY